jgi:glycosidase
MPHPLLYEINTRCWLRGLSEAAGANVTLANVPESEITGWRKLGFTHIWLMGVWTTGPRARVQAIQDATLQRSYAEVLPDWKEEDVWGSPYAIGDYRVPPTMGGEGGLAQFRARLNATGLKLVLDFVPNHLGLDHSWVMNEPDFFVQARPSMPDAFRQETASGVRWLAHGKDPYFPGWTDTVQLDYRRQDVRAAMTGLLGSIADRCDGVRCDMAMLLLKDVFAKTWDPFPMSELVPAKVGHAETPPARAPVAGEFWQSAISTVKKDHSDFLFLAEAYWGLEPRLHELGFDYTYDKTLYDRMVWRDAGGVHDHLAGLDAGAIRKDAHFLENHDEPRIAAALSPAEHRAAALIILGLPGMRFLHEGQLAGATRKIPVQLARRPVEPMQAEINGFYSSILAALPATAVGRGTARLLRPQAAWPDNPTARNFVIVQWQDKPAEFDLVVVNLAPHRSQCWAQLNIEGLGAHDWSMKDLLGREEYLRRGENLINRGLYLDLPAHGAQIFHFQPDARKRG